MKNKFLAVSAMMLLLVSGCAPVVHKLAEVTANDLKRTSELAEKYGKPEVKQCSDFLVSSIEKLQADENALHALLQEQTNGVFSAALKAVLVKDYLASLNDPARADAFKKEFDAACKSVAGTIVLNLAMDAAKVAKQAK